MILRTEVYRGFAPALVVGLLLTAFPPRLTAQEAPGEEGAAVEDRDEIPTVEEEIVVSAHLTDRPRKQVGSSVTVIDREEIERRNKTTVLEILRSVSGLEVTQTGGPGKTSSVFIRGGNSSHTLVTVDGVRVNSNTSGAFDFSELTTDNLERIEVLRGPQSVLYGSEAMSGVVSIVTRPGGGPFGAWVRGSVGSHSFYQGAAGVRGGSPHKHYGLSASRLSTDAVSAASEEAGNSEEDPWQNLTASATLGGTFLDDGSIDAAIRYTDGETDVDGFTFGIGPTDDLNAVTEREASTGSVRLQKPITRRWAQSLRVASSRDTLMGRDPDDVFNNFEIRSDTVEITTQADLTVSRRGTVSVGYQVERRQGENVGSFDESLYLRSLFAENLWTWGESGSLSLGVRNDDHSVFGSETTYRLATSVSVAPTVRLHGSLGTGFKAPTFNDLYFPGFGSPDLRPESSDGYDVGLEWTTKEGRLRFDLTYFATDFEDLIQFTFPAGLRNVAAAESSGVEIAFDWRVGDRFQVRGSHTLNETEDLNTGRQLARRPEHRSTVDLFFEPGGKLRGAASVVSVRDRIDSDGSPMDDYERVDLSLDYEVNTRLRPFARIENLFDEDYAEIPGFTTLGANLTVGVRLSL